MKLIYDEWDCIWVWVLTTSEDTELSPRFDEEQDAVQWQTTIRKIFTGK